jgi:two-component system, sensor histidine kinase and response regulator
VVSKILVIEDELNVRKNIVELLESEDFEVFSAKDGFEGIFLAQAHSPELILCDVNMPELDGYGVLSNLRKDPDIAITPFIFLTAKAASEEIREGMNLGADDYLTKPFSRQELLNTIKARLSKQKIHAQSTDTLLKDIGESLSYSISEKIFNPLDEILAASEVFIQDAKVINPNDIESLGEHIQSNTKFLKRAILNIFMFLNMELMFHSSDALETIKNIYTTRPGDFVYMIAMQLARKHDCSKNLVVNIDNARLKISTSDWNKIVEESLGFIFSLFQKGSLVDVNTKIVDDNFQYFVRLEIDELPYDLLHKISRKMLRDQAYFEDLDSGLGLLITHFIVKLYGGEFIVKNEKTSWGDAITLLISLPIYPAEEDMSLLIDAK